LPRLNHASNSIQTEASDFGSFFEWNAQREGFDLGAVFAPSDPGPVSRHADRLFARIRSVIKDRCADPDFGPAEVAAETRISLRYVQKLLSARGSTCSELIYSIRLDHAAHLLECRASLGTGQHLSEIAYACGFRDYAHCATAIGLVMHRGAHRRRRPHWQLDSARTCW
jgi:AraC-like DNA-binding protein